MSYTIVHENQSIHICRPDGQTMPVKQRRRKRYWCFRCRQHLLHRRMMFLPPIESYYGPNYWWECSRCHQEHVLFPGREWVEVEAP